MVMIFQRRFDMMLIGVGQRLLALPVGTFWADPISYDTIKTVMDIPEIGKVSLIRTSKAAAKAPTTPQQRQKSPAPSLRHNPSRPPKPHHSTASYRESQSVRNPSLKSDSLLARISHRK